MMRISQSWKSKPVHDIGDIRNKNNRMRSGFLFGLMAVLVIGILVLKHIKIILQMTSRKHQNQQAIPAFLR